VTDRLLIGFVLGALTIIVLYAVGIIG